MASFRQIVDAPANSRLVLQGNAAFALGVIHAGYHAADGYPGTPSTEVIDESLSQVQDLIKVGWSVNEAVAFNVGLGHSIGGADVVVTMKIPGVFQAADPISTTGFFTAEAGALVIYAATDYVPSSTQHVVDARYFFASLKIPVLEPIDHQQLYEMPRIAADMSRKYRTPVIIYTSGILCHSEALIVTKEKRVVEQKKVPDNLKQWLTLPSLVRENFLIVMKERLPQLQTWAEDSDLVQVKKGKEDWGIILSGESHIIVKEAMQALGKDPSILSLSITNPLPVKRIKKFADSIKGKIFVIEDGDKYIEERIRLQGINVIGKEEFNTLTDWTPELVVDFLSKHIETGYKKQSSTVVKPIPRPPAICPGCPYRAFSLVVAQMKKQKKIYGAFGDIGCSTLLMFLNAVDTVSCMGASDAMRQGFVLSNPDYASTTISVIGDSCECHSGLDATRNSVFRNIPGVKIVLDNTVTAMTGGQPAPSTPLNLAGKPHKFDLSRAVEAEGGRTVIVDAYKIADVQKELTAALDAAKEGVYSTLVLKGRCIKNAVEAKDRVRKLQHNHDACKKCGMCGICPGIVIDEKKKPSFTNLCTNCGSSTQVCRQRCKFGAIVPIEESKNELSAAKGTAEKVVISGSTTIDEQKLPESLRVAIRGIGGQGNLFFGKVLSEVALRTPYAQSSIVKGETHGMAQLGGPVISTFSCGNVYSPTLLPHTVDVLVVMEVSELLRPGFLELLKPNGTIIINKYKVLPVNTTVEQYPKDEDIAKSIQGYKVIYIDALDAAIKIGDTVGRSANVVVLGLLSTIEPFCHIPETLWLSAVMSLSSNDSIKATNYKAFTSGRTYAV